MKKKRKHRTGWIVFTVVAIVCVVFVLLLLVQNLLPGVESDNIAVIPIEGMIVGGNSFQEGFFSGGGTANSGVIVQFLEAANEDKNIKAIILNINSPGGAVVPSKEIVDAVKKIDKPVVALIREVGASGAYWVASASDVIIADPLSVTGSIGVFGGYLEFSDLISRYDVEYHSLKTGKYKDLGNQFVDLDEEGEKILQGKLKIIHNYFVQDVSENRRRDLSVYGNGLFYLGSEALEIGLVDELGGKEEAERAAKDLAGLEDAELVFYKKEVRLIDVLSGLVGEFGSSVGSGLGKELSLKEDFVINV